MEISALSGYHGVVGKFSEDFGIELTEEQAKKLTAVYRNIFSPDTDPESIHEMFDDLSSKYLYQKIVPRIQKIREEARKLKNTKENIKKWNKETDSIIKDIYEHIYKNT